MLKQMNIFDFIEKTQESEKPEFKSMFEELFTKINDPIIQCANCLCGYCANNVEEVWRKVKPGELKKPCFNCDECINYTGDFKHRSRREEDCMEFILSDYAAISRRKKIKLVT